MRIIYGLTFLAVLALTPSARADGIGCGGDDTSSALGHDMAVRPSDLSHPPPLDLHRHEGRRSQHARRRAAAAGMLLVAGVSGLVVAASRRRGAGQP